MTKVYSDGFEHYDKWPDEVTGPTPHRALADQVHGPEFVQRYRFECRHGNGFAVCTKGEVDLSWTQQFRCPEGCALLSPTLDAAIRVRTPR